MTEIYVTRAVTEGCHFATVGQVVRLADGKVVAETRLYPYGFQAQAIDGANALARRKGLRLTGDDALERALRDSDERVEDLRRLRPPAVDVRLNGEALTIQVDRDGYVRVHGLHTERDFAAILAARPDVAAHARDLRTACLRSEALRLELGR